MGRKSTGVCERYIIDVDATAVHITAAGPKIYAQHPEGHLSSSISVEGELDKPVLKRVTRAYLTVFEDQDIRGNPGSAIGGNSIWHVVCVLPQTQFQQLLALASSSKLRKVDMLFEKLRRGKAPLRSIMFRTEPVPSDADADE